MDLSNLLGAFSWATWFGKAAGVPGANTANAASNVADSMQKFARDSESGKDLAKDMMESGASWYSYDALREYLWPPLAFAASAIISILVASTGIMKTMEDVLGGLLDKGKALVLKLAGSLLAPSDPLTVSAENSKDALTSYLGQLDDSRGVAPLTADALSALQTLTGTARGGVLTAETVNALAKKLADAKARASAGDSNSLNLLVAMHVTDDTVNYLRAKISQPAAPAAAPAAVAARAPAQLTADQMRTVLTDFMKKLPGDTPIQFSPEVVVSISKLTGTAPDDKNRLSRQVPSILLAMLSDPAKKDSLAEMGVNTDSVKKLESMIVMQYGVADRDFDPTRPTPGLPVPQRVSSTDVTRKIM